MKHRVARLCISVICIVFLINSLDGHVFIETIESIEPFVFVVAVVCFVILSGLQTLRWIIILRKLDVLDIALKAALGSVMVGTFFNQSLPSSLGGDVVRVWSLSHSRSSFEKILSSVVIERLAAVVGMVLVTTLSLPFAASFISDSRILWSVALTNVAASVILCFVIWSVKIPYVDKLFAGRMGLGIQTVALNIRKVAFSPSAFPVILCSVVLHFSVSLIFWLLALGQGIQISPMACIVFVPIVLLATTIPISVAGWGVRESMVVLLLSFVGVPAPHALATSILFGLALAAAALPGGLIWVISRRRPHEPTSE